MKVVTTILLPLLIVGAILFFILKKMKPTAGATVTRPQIGLESLTNYNTGIGTSPPSTANIVVTAPNTVFTKSDQQPSISKPTGNPTAENWTPSPAPALVSSAESFVQGVYPKAVAQAESAQELPVTQNNPLQQVTVAPIQTGTDPYAALKAASLAAQQKAGQYNLFGVKTGGNQGSGVVSVFHKG